MAPRFIEYLGEGGKDRLRVNKTHCSLGRVWSGKKINKKKHPEKPGPGS